MAKRDSIFALPYVHEKDGQPYVRLNYKDERTGRWRSKEKRVNTIDDAIAAYEELKKQVGAQPSDYDPDRITFAELMAEFKKVKSVPEWYARPLEEYFGQRRLKTITYGDLREFRAAREAVPHKATGKPRKPVTINREMEWLREILLYAVRHEWLARNPFLKGPETLIPKSEEEPRSRVPSPEEEAKILAHCVDERAHLRPILIALRDTGLRRGALLSLQWKNVDLDQGFLEIPKGKGNKGRPRIIAMTARLRAELRGKWEAESPDPDSPIFGGIKSFKRAYNTACRKAGIKDLRVHDWRHGFATDLMEAGVDERLAMKATGHNNSETHHIYTNIDKRLAKAIAESLDRLHADRQKESVTDGTHFVS